MPNPTSTAASYPVDATNKVRRLRERAAYDHDTIHALLDAAMMCHVAYVVDGQPFCTPTFFWREGSKLYWHGSSASRMLRNLSDGEPVCLTVTHLDSLVLARSAINHSADYRSVLAFGKARLVQDPQEKARALVMMVDRLYPGRTAELRAGTRQEAREASVVMMEIERASAKIRSQGVTDDDEDYALPIYAERIPVRMVLGEPEPCGRLLDGIERPKALAGYRGGRSLQDALTEAHAVTFPPSE